MYSFKGGWGFCGRSPIQTSSHKLFYVFDRPAQAVQHDQSYFLSLSRPVQLWISHNVEHGHKMKRIHDRGGGMNSLESWQDAQGVKNSAHNNGSPFHTIRQRKHFAFFGIPTGLQLASSGQSLNTQ